jgi:hypothetical protein
MSSTSTVRVRGGAMTIRFVPSLQRPGSSDPTIVLPLSLRWIKVLDVLL